MLAHVIAIVELQANSATVKLKVIYLELRIEVLKLLTSNINN